MAETKKTEPATVKSKATPAATEATEETGTLTLEIEVNDTTVELKLPATFEDADPDAIVAMEEEKPTVAFKALIGDTNWKRLKALRWTARDFRSVVEAWQESVGLGNG